MATTKRVVRRSSKKSAAKSSGSKNGKPASSGRAAKRSHDDLLKLVPAIVKARKSGDNWDTIQKDHGVNAIVARKLLAEKGYNAKGEALEVEEIKGSGKALAKRVATARRSGKAWHVLAIATGRSEADLRGLLEEHGYKEEASGRAYASGGGSKAAPAAKKTGRKVTARRSTKDPSNKG